MTEERVCGTGGYSGPQPGDPDNNSVLTATPAFGGIDLNWTYPELNPHAVAHVNIYRSTAGTAGTAQKIATIGGSFYYDRTAELSATPITYFYWIEIVSVNGTVNDWIGPASAMERQPIGDIIESLTSKIDREVLAGALKQELDTIQTNKLEVDAALLEKAASDDALAASIETLTAHSDETRAMVEAETVARTSALDAFVSTVNTLYADFDSDLTAAVQTEQTARASADDALAEQISSAQASLGDTIAGVQQTMSTQVQGELLLRNGAFATGDLGGWSGWVGAAVVARDSGSATAMIQNAPALYALSFPDSGHDVARQVAGDWFPVTEGQAYVTRADYAGVGVSDMNLTLSLAVEWRNDETGATSEELQQSVVINAAAPGWDRLPVTRAIPPAGMTSGRVIVRREMGGIGQLLVTNVVGHKADSTFEAEYTAQVQANGLIGGFGLYNDGTTVDAGFDVDRFWVGRTQQNKRKPFIIATDVDGNQTVYMDTAMIRDATIEEGKLGPISVGKLTKSDGTPITTVGGLLKADAIDVGNLDVRSATRFSGDVFSNNWESGVSGWALLQNGYAEFNEAMIRGNLEVQSITVNGNSPFGAASVSFADGTTSSSCSTGSGGCWYSAGTGGWKSSSDYDRYTGTKVIEEMPSGSRLNLVLYPRVSWSGYTNPGWQGTCTTNNDAANNYTKTIGGYARCKLDYRVRVLVDGEPVYDQSKVAFNKDYNNTYIRYSSSGQDDDYNSGIEIPFTYSEYKATSVIQVDVWLNSYQNVDDMGFAGGSLDVDGTNIISGDVFRLG